MRPGAWRQADACSAVKRHGLTAGLLALILLMDLFESVAEVYFKAAAQAASLNRPEMGQSGCFALLLASQPALWLGILFYALNYTVWMAVLSGMEPGAALPVGSAACVFVPALSAIFLHEQVTPLRWAGILFIFTGVCFVSRAGRGRS